MTRPTGALASATRADIKRMLDALRAEALRSESVPSADIFRLTDPIMDAISR